MASAEPPPLSDDGFWFWDGSKWRSLVSADGQTSWNGKAWVPLPPFLIGKTMQPPAGPPRAVASIPPPAPPAAPPAHPPAPAQHLAQAPPVVPGQLPSPPGYTPPPPPPAEVEPRPSWLPADAPWPPATFTASPTSGPLTVDAPMAAAAPGAVPWANVYSDVIASSTASQGYRYAGFWIRWLAYFIDGVIVYVPITIVFLYLLGGSAAIASKDPAQITPVAEGYQLLYLAASFIYFIFFWTQGSTLGMRVMGIRVADETTFGSIGIGRAILRFIGFLVSGYCCYIGFIWAAFDSHHQGWHDKMGRSVVVHR